MRSRSIRTFITLVFLTSFISSCSTTSENKPAAYSHFKIGVSFVAKGQYAKGLDHLLKAKQFDPRNPLYLNHLGLTYYFMEEHALAIQAMKNAIEEKPSYSEAHNNLGRTYIEIKDFESARKHLLIAAADLTYPHQDKVWLNMGLSYFMQNKFKKSQNYFLKSISANRSNCLAYNYYGRTEIELENFRKAAKILDQAIYHCRKKGTDEPHYYSAIALFRTGYKSRAMARLKEGRKLFPSGPNRTKMDEMLKLMSITEAQ